MYYVYVLYSKRFNKIYIGCTSDLDARFLSHNKFANKGYTVRYRPWLSSIPSNTRRSQNPFGAKNNSSLQRVGNSFGSWSQNINIELRIISAGWQTGVQLSLALRKE
jgi:hypothetical protein